MNRDLLVYVDLDGRAIPCGRLWTRAGPRESASFEYDATWFKDRAAFGIDPELPLGPGRFHTASPLFRAFTDPSPDRWGQTLLRRAERSRAKREGRSPRTLAAVDFLTLVADETRLGALRFRDASEDPDAPFLSSTGKPVPPLLLLRKLLSATDRIIANEESDDDLALLLAPGTSLGGARPKASVRDVRGELLIAKFPRKDDDWPMTRWEAATLSLAKAAGIQVPKFRLEQVLKKPVLLLERFDRNGSVRLPFMSAMTALSADDHQSRSYTDIVDAIRREGSRVTEDLRELWRRLVFNILVSNTDDHLRNHGFLRAVGGFRLAPAYDLNPTPTDVRPRTHSLGINEPDATASFDVALGVSQLFGIPKSEARAIAREVTAAVRTWRTVASRFGLKPKDLERMESAFEHEDLEHAAKL